MSSSIVELRDRLDDIRDDLAGIAEALDLVSATTCDGVQILTAFTARQLSDLTTRVKTISDALAEGKS